MSDIKSGRSTAVTSVSLPVPFRFRVVHGMESSRKSTEQRAVTRQLSLSGLIFEIPVVEVDGMHISFTEASFGRNFMEITLDLGKKTDPIEILGQVEWYESRYTPRGDIFIVGVSFVDIPADAIALLRGFIRRVASAR
jgi:hypothetical protein